MDVRSFYNDPALCKTLGCYLDEKTVAERFEKSAADLASTECYIPVLGTQGAGKSSFLNAVLFSDIVLPVDADETTCIPTAVKYGENEQPEAYVVFGTGERRKVPCSEEGLADYVHQEKNPGNEKGISHIEIVQKNDLLRDGIVFVDLPGVGSITAANQRTTLEYLKKCAAAIFMLRTVPPITGSEAVFIQGALPLMGKVFWVQNQWTDESKDEVAEGREHNYKVLKQLASRLNMPESTISTPDVVCVKRALDGKVQDNAEQIAASGMEAFRNSVVSFAHDWQKDLFGEKQAQAVALLKAAAEAADAKAGQLQGDAEEERAKIAEVRREAEAIIDHNAEIVRDVRDYLSDKESDLQNLIYQECQRNVAALRNGIRETIDKGVVDGEQLEKAFQDYAKRGCEDMFTVIQPEFVAIEEEVRQKLSQIVNADFASLAAGVSAGDGENFSAKSKTHEYYTVGGAATGAGIAATVIILNSWNPLGWTAAGVALVLTTLGTFLGAKARKAKVEKQKIQARVELLEAANKYMDELCAKYRRDASEYVSKMKSGLRDWMRTQKDAVEAQFQKASADLERPAEEKSRAAETAVADAKRFRALAGELEGA